jgi:hypothetical protein
VAEITIFTGNPTTALFSSQFEELADAADVDDASASIIDAINGICFIKDSARSPLRRGGVHERLPTGEWGGGKAFATMHAVGRARAVAFAVTLDKDGNVRPSPQTPQSVWLQNAVKEKQALEVLSYVRGTPDWFLLYKAHETMKKGGAPANWPDAGRFTQSANIHRHFSGHSSARQSRKKPFVPMSLREATDFVRSLATLWFASKFPDPESPS